jgi:hypothetical protein
MNILITLLALWMVFAIPAYLLTRLDYQKRGWSWEHRDALFMGFLCILGGPIVMLLVSSSLLCPKALTKWLGEKSRW